MILPRFSYKKAWNVAEAVALCEGRAGAVSYLAGGTDLMPLAKQRLVLPELMVDLKGVEELKAIRVSDGLLVIGANVTLFDLKNHPVVKDRLTGLAQSLEATSCETLQMRGTIGGNILQNTRCLFYNKSAEWRAAKGSCLKTGGTRCNAVPGGKVCFANYCSDNAPSLIVLGAEARFVGPGGERRTPVEKLFTGNGVTPHAVEPGEVLTEVSIPLDKAKSAYEKLRVRDSMDYPLVGVAVALKEDGGRVCLTGIGPTPLAYTLDSLAAAAIEDVAGKAYSDAKPVANTVLTAAYRKKMAAVLVRRAVENALKEEK